MTSINGLFDDDNDGDEENLSSTLNEFLDEDDGIDPTFGDVSDNDDDFEKRRINQSIASGSYRSGGENMPKEVIDLPLQPAVQEQRLGPVARVGSKLRIVSIIGAVTLIVSVLIAFLAWNAMKTTDIADPPIKNAQVGPSQEPLSQGKTGEDGNKTGDNGAATDNVVVPAGGKYIRYEIKGDPSITSSSVRWYDSKGSQRSNLGIDLPWNQPVGRDKGVMSAIAVATKGSGTITCTIFDKNNNILSQRSSSGNNPTVQCSSK